MTRLLSLLAAMALALSACGPSPTNSVDGPRVYKISKRDEPKIEARALEFVNSSRASSGLAPLIYDPALVRAAESHSRDMSAQNRPWHWGSDGSSPIDRAYRSGFTGTWLGENISETYENEMVTLNAWMGDSGTRSVVMDPAARYLGFGWYQERAGKIWWTLVTGG